MLSPLSALTQLASASVGSEKEVSSLENVFMSGVTPLQDDGALAGPETADMRIVIGVDEAGRGPLAGPVVAAACAIVGPVPSGVTDSKRLTAKRRAALDEALREGAHLWAVAACEPDEIDRINIFQATMQAMTHCVAQLVAAIPAAIPGARIEVLVDGNMTPAGRCADWRWPARAIVSGDAIEPAISAASIIAKEHRDRLMCEAARHHPHYGWERNKGYGTREHLDALRDHGPCALHRRSFAPVAQCAVLL